MLESSDHNPIEKTSLWFQKAIPDPQEKNFHTQLGCHFEEVREMVQELTVLEADTIPIIENLKRALEDAANHLKVSNHVVMIHPGDRTNFLDSLADQVVTATGCAVLQEMDMVGAMDEVNRSNFSKFDDDGNPIFNENMKIMKSDNYVPADFTDYI